ncbi:MAG: monofunctional biosynthetic peptidoglycan transglycosylase [Bacteroidia bacterium]|nr:monofunctional biosynthetic peptidoglycan transglycosylase [Bacteroidia bacterium]
MGIFRTIFRFIWRTTLFLIITSIFLSITYRYINPPFTALMFIRLVQQMKNKKEICLKNCWIRYNSLPEYVGLAFIASEDQKFTEHSGFDFKSIEKAMKNYKKGKKIRGASTISQQTAKNVFLWPNRSWLRKGLEVCFTFFIELVWGKKRILEVYLNVVEMGDGIYGIGAASEYYFNKPASKLTKSEAAQIAAVLPNPRKWNAKKPGPYVLKRKNWILGQMNNIGEIKF